MGGFSKLLTDFIRTEHPGYIKTLADLRYSDPNSNMYTRTGFVCSNDVEPRYFYTDGVKREHRFSYRKDRIKKAFPDIYDSSLTEFQMMDKTGM